jgi:hypothetical protein
MWAIRSNLVFYSQGANPRWYGDVLLATHFEDEQDAHDEAREVLGLDPIDYVLEPVYPKNPRLPDGRRFRKA